jgi:hypothetical protein
MKFYVPSLKNKIPAERIYQALERLAQETVSKKMRDVKIKSITYYFKDTRYSSSVGEIDQRTHELVYAIFEYDHFLLFTTHNGVASGTPMVIKKTEAVSVGYW